MTPRSKILTTVSLIAFLTVLGIADYKLAGDRFTASVDTTTESSMAMSEASAAPTGVAKQNGADCAQVIKDLGMSTEKSADLSFIAQVMTKDATISSLAILKDGDRAGSVTWIDSPNVKSSFIALKEALLSAFSPLVADLHDETIDDPRGPTKNVLTFTDPSLSTERLAFVRVRQRLYEFHIATGKEAPMQAVMEGVTK